MRSISRVAILIAFFGVSFAQKDTTASNQLIKIHTKARILEFFENDTLVFSFPIRVGKDDTPTPLGTAYVYIKRNPPLFFEVDKETGEQKILREAECADGKKKIDYKRMRALGLRYEKVVIDPAIARKLNLGKHPIRYSIHSTMCEETIGTAMSNGCVGMTIDNMGDLYPRISDTGVPVIITDDSTLVYWQLPEHTNMYEKLFADLEDKGYTRKELENIFSDPRITFYPHIYKKRQEEEKNKIRELQKEHKKRLEKELEDKQGPAPSQKYFKEPIIQKGREFLVSYDSLLSRVEKIYGVDKEIIVSLIQAESHFGQNTGIWRIFNVYNTYFLFHPIKSYRAWGRKELIAYLTIAKQNNWHAFEKYGSTAGAFGIPQFIPSSYLGYGIDGDNDGIVDLWNMADAMHSVANYLKEHGWIKGWWNRENSTALWKYNRDWTYVWLRAHYAKAIGWKPQES